MSQFTEKDAVGSFMSDKIKRQISMLESDIETLKWVIS